jgi:hypothetical protein
MSFRPIYRILEKSPLAGASDRTGIDWRFTAVRRCPDCFNSAISLHGTFAVSLKQLPIAAGPGGNSRTAEGCSTAQ